MEHKKLHNNEIYEKNLTSSSSKNLCLKDANLAIFALNLKKLITVDLVNIFHSENRFVFSRKFGGG
jgi:hypothetical protein